LGVSTGLHCSVDECPCTVDKFKAFVDEFWASGDKPRITIDIHQATVDRHWTTVDGHGVRLHECRCTVDISKNFVDEPINTSRVWVDTVYHSGMNFPFRIDNVAIFLILGGIPSRFGLVGRGEFNYLEEKTMH